MKQATKKQITEEDVMFHDLDPVLYGDTFQVKFTPSCDWKAFSFSEFAGFLQDTGRVVVADNDSEYIHADGIGYTFQRFWSHIVSTTEADDLLRDYFTVKTIAA